MKESLEDYTRVMRGRYARRTGKQARSALLDEYCRSSGLERKHVFKVLRGQRRRGATAAARGARSTYGSEDITVLKAVQINHRAALLFKPAFRSAQDLQLLAFDIDFHDVWGGVILLTEGVPPHGRDGNGLGGIASWLKRFGLGNELVHRRARIVCEAEFTIVFRERTAMHIHIGPLVYR